MQGLDMAEIVPLDQIARAHELIEHPANRRVVAIHKYPDVKCCWLFRKLPLDWDTVPMN